MTAYEIQDTLEKIVLDTLQEYRPKCSTFSIYADEISKYMLSKITFTITTRGHFPQYFYESFDFIEGIKGNNEYTLKSSILQALTLWEPKEFEKEYCELKNELNKRTAYYRFLYKKILENE